jgi:hypothetical protein
VDKILCGFEDQLILVSDFEGLKETDGCRGYQYQNLEI